MRDSLSDRLLRRELQDSAGRSRKIRTIYGDSNWIKNLDIVNELDGHSGCVNALSWSKSGRLLASGSDDQHINIHTYQPDDDSTSQFSLATSIATGHRANIFSVKFMPHSNDRTIISAAGDREVRIFDIEYSGAATEASGASVMASHSTQRRRNNAYDRVRRLTDGDTNCRVYRSHGDRVKRVVTESSPHLFLTCSEDGEVRQWDLRQPSSAYPSPSRRTGSDTSVPPPLISYKRYDLDLNTISCSPSQPHYIALGGAHLHCFLHDRRMLGRDKLHERAASPALSATNLSDLDQDALGHATQCVRKFAPQGKSVMKRTDNGHITACKISDAHPNEMIVSWSGDHIYSFDLVRSPDAREDSSNVAATSSTKHSRRARESSEKKRKRKSGSQLSVASDPPSQVRSRQRTEDTADGDGEVALRVRYENGQSEDIPIERRSPVSSLRESVMSSTQKKSYRLARGVVNLRSSMFTLGNSTSSSNDDPVGHATTFTKVRDQAGKLLPQMTDMIRSWRYPVDPSAEEVYLQRTLRSNRESAWRLVQASGVIARALGGRLHTVSTESPATPLFTRIEHVPNESVNVTKMECFGYDFIKAIFLWLDSGLGALIEGFTRSSDVAKYASRLPVPRDASADAFDECIIPYLLRCASDRPIYNVDASRFEVDGNRIMYATEMDAVNAFVEAVKTPFADLSSSAATGSATEPSQNRTDALVHWGLKVARGLLMNAAEGVNFAFVDRAFGGLGTGNSPAAREEARFDERQRDIDVNEEDLAVRTMELTNVENDQSSEDEEEEEEEEEEDVIALSDLRASMQAVDDDEDSMLIDDDDGWEEDDDDDDEEDEDDMDVEVEEEAEEDDDDEEEEEEEDEEPGFPQMMYQNAFERRRKRGDVERDVYCSPHTRTYRGHCNVKTVKDVNFFGLDDEYVVSGSDDGNFFIWDRKTSKLLNILEGDGEVVNVVQGHPYEPMLAVSGIDHTVKIFSPDSRARESARLGRGVEAADVSNFSSISSAARMRVGRVARQSGGVKSEPAMGPGAADGREEDDDEYVAQNGLVSRKRWHLEHQITSQNDVDRQGGNQEAFITRSMLATLAQQIRRQREGGDEGEGVAGGRIAIGDDCVVQ